jgi:hypothetical protein
MLGQLQHAARGLIERIVALLRHGAMGRHTAEGSLEPERALMADEGRVAGRLAHHQRAGLGQDIAEPGEKAGAVAAGLLPRGEDQHQARFAARQPGEVDRRQGHGGDAALHVAGAAAVKPVAVDLPAQGIETPGGGAERHGIEMPGEAEGWCVVRPFESRNEAGASLGEAVEAHFQPSRFQEPTEMLGAGLFIPRRIDGAQPGQLLRQGDGGHLGDRCS